MEEADVSPGFGDNVLSTGCSKCNSAPARLSHAREFPHPILYLRIRYRDPKTIATGICPATDSPLYRTSAAEPHDGQPASQKSIVAVSVRGVRSRFMERVKAPQTVVLSEWATGSAFLSRIDE